MQEVKLDWRLCAAIAVVTFIILGRAGEEGINTAPLWALLGGFAAVLGATLLRKRPNEG